MVRIVQPVIGCVRPLDRVRIIGNEIPVRVAHFAEIAVEGREEPRIAEFILPPVCGRS